MNDKEARAAASAVYAVGTEEWDALYREALSEVDYAALTDGALARALAAALERSDYEATVFAENEVADRLKLSLDETEQGFTPAATEAVDKWVEANKGGT